MSDQKSHQTSALSKGDASEHNGTLPTLGQGEPKAVSKEAAEQSPQVSPRGLNRWGPWKRWNSIRSVKRFERDNPSYWRKSDSEENAKGKLPPDEDVQLPAIWVVELYTPSTVNRLLDGIGDLGWEYGLSKDTSLMKWMADVRQGRKAGWMSLGPVSPPDVKDIMSERTASMPKGVRAALPILSTLTPSLTALVIVYIFDDKTATSLDATLREEFETTFQSETLSSFWRTIKYVLMNKRVRLGRQIRSPDIARRMAVSGHIAELENECMEWVQDNLPGTFSLIPGSGPPTAVLLVTKKVKPFTKEARKIRSFEGLAIDRDWDVWKSDRWPEAGVALPMGFDSERNRLTLACRRRDVVEKTTSGDDLTSNWSISYRANDHVRGLLTRWAITCLQNSYHEVLSSLRDKTAQDRKYRTVRDLKQLRSLARTTLYDVGACAQEMIEFAGSDSAYDYDVLELIQLRTSTDAPINLLAELKSSQTKRADRIRREATLVESALSTSNELSQTISTIRLQRLVVLLTVLSVIIASWVAVLTFSTTPS